ncbi:MULTISPECIES: PP2C family protein-serine/threonine phosphatase [Saccharothrix]|uniref:PP2C family protein-serine/threonine phosphatase n=1 Tax=Saccharothrix TaxID=2071 RepID=UPI00093BEDE4|nr:PP2C family protein-serine/threonine phosphatase [Saccharothrix sp. CB00851]OKI19839.1 serine/threonine protein phosphatase [Saccharothrix sp. CB00851]
MTEQAGSWHAVFSRIVDESHVAGADELAGIVNGATAMVGVSVQLYLVDLSQQRLHPVRSEVGPSLPVDSSTAGVAFRRMEVLAVPAADGTPPCLWLPVLNGTERLGVARVVLPADGDPHNTWLREQCWVLVSLIAHLVTSKHHYSDLFHRVRRTKPLTVASELLWQLLPPQTFACDRMVVTAALEPYDQVGGDGYDYAVDAGHAHVALFDSTGHDLHAGLTTAVALAATRNARRGGLGLVEAARLADQAIAVRNGPDRMTFATAVLGRLDLDSGLLRYLNAGHPPPVLLRDGKMVKALDAPVRTPLGLGHLGGSPAAQPATEQLQPGDRVLFHTDGVTEARSPDGALFGLDRLVDLTERHEAAGLPAPETLRRIVHAVLEHQHGSLQDDATLLLLEWTTTGQLALFPTL